MSFLITLNTRDRLWGFLKTELAISIDIYVRGNPNQILQIVLCVYVECSASLLTTGLLFFSCSCCLDKGLHCGGAQRGEGVYPSHHPSPTQSGDINCLECLPPGRRALGSPAWGLNSASAGS